MGHLGLFVTHTDFREYGFNPFPDGFFIFPAGSFQDEFQIFIYIPVDQ